LVFRADDEFMPMAMFFGIVGLLNMCGAADNTFPDSPCDLNRRVRIGTQQTGVPVYGTSPEYLEYGASA
jgi:hypothetical protein